MANTANSDKWYFTKEQLENTPSRKCGYNSFKELTYRQQAANFIQDMGQRLKVSLLCINTAIVYMHRFYVFHSFTQFPWHQMAAAALFLAAKVEEQPRKLEYVIRIANLCRNPKDTSFDINSERYLTQSQDLVFNENVLLQTLGFDVAIDHPHTHVVRCCDLVRASKDLAQTSYFMATYSLHLTTMCIQYKPSVVACFCILVACKWSNWEIPLSNEKKEWYSYVDATVTAELLQQLTEEFLKIFENSPSRLKEKINATANLGHSSSPMNPALKTARDESIKDLAQHRAAHEAKTMSDAASTSFSQKQQQREREYRERKERERLAHQQQQQQKQILSGSSKAMPSSSHSVHHRPPIDPKLKSATSHSRPPSSGSAGGVSGSYAPSARVEPRDILREAARDSPFGIASKEYRQSGGAPSVPPLTASEKDLQLKTQRDYLLKPNVTSELVDTRYCGDKQQRIEPNRASNASTTAANQTSSSSSRSTSSGSSNNSSLIKNKVVPNNKHEQVRRHDEPIKAELDLKKHLSSSSSSGSSVHDKGYLSKMNSTSLKQIKTSPSMQQDIKSVPKQQQQQSSIANHHNQLIGAQSAVMNKHHHNGGSYNVQHHHQHGEVKRETHDVKLELPDIKTEMKEDVVQVKRPGLFSPEKSPPQMQRKTSGGFKQETVDGTESPRRRRHYSSSSSEPELRPVIKKIDQVEGFENLMRDTTIGMNKFHQIPDIITPISDAPKLKVKEEFVGPGFSKEMKPPDIIPPLNSSDGKIQHNNSTISSIVNGIETNPALISNLLKETAVPLSHLPTANVALPLPSDQQTELKEKDHHHHKSKKKNKEKHKHKDKSREDKDKKKKHKDKDREKSKYKEHKHEQQQLPQIAEPIKIKIHKDKIQPLVSDNHNIIGGPGGGIALKIKIPKDKIKTESIGEVATSSSSSSVGGGSLKIKIPKDVINNCNQAGGDASGGSLLNNSANSRKRERDRNASSNNEMQQQPPTKLSKSSYKESKQNGRHPYKVAQMGDGDTSLHRLAESKYITKGSSS